MPDQNKAPLFFVTQAEFRAWLADNHAAAAVQWVGYYKKATGVPSIDWPQSVDEALCFGWIDGLRRSIDEERYKIRFTPRRRGSHWSGKNLDRMPELIEAGLVEPAGLAAYESRNVNRERQASYERPGPIDLSDDYLAELRAVDAAWTYWQDARPSYRKQVAHWVTSAKKEETRRRRLGILVESCANGDLIPQMRWTAKRR